MAISVDTVYQRVQSILNKESRGYLTPQEFNLFANQAQLEIFEQYFFDLNQFERLPKKDTEYSNLVKTINERISKFKTSATLTFTTPYFSMPSDMHKLGTVIYNSTTPVEEIDQKNLLEYTLSPLTAPSTTNPVYIQNIQTTSSVWSIVVYPSSIDGTTGQVITATYIRKPVDASWASKTIVGNALYDASNSTNFDLLGDIISFRKILLHFSLRSWQLLLPPKYTDTIPVVHSIVQIHLLLLLPYRE